MVIDVPHSLRLYTAVFYVGVVCAVFVYLLYTGYMATETTEFLEPYSGGAANPGCKLMTISHTGKYQATFDGHWEGSETFTYNKAIYSYSLTAHAATASENRHEMDRVYKELHHFGEMASTHSLENNLLLWMSMVIVNNSSNAQRFSMVGNPLVVFDRDHTDAVVSSVHGNCNVSSTAHFDNINGWMSVSFNYKSFVAEPTCLNAMDPALFGYNTVTKPELFTIQYDIRTLITGLAVNLHIMKLDELVEIPEYKQVVVHDGIKMTMHSYYDPRYAGMSPLKCAIVDGFDPFCVTQIGEVLMFPVYHHLGANLSYPEECDCAVLTEESLSDPSHNCNVFRFMSGFLFVNNEFDAAYMFALRVTKLKTYDAIEIGAYHAQFIASSYGQNSPFTEQLNSEESLQEAYDFCTVGAQSCSMITFTSYDIKATNWAVSKYHTVLQNGACRDTFSPSIENWNQLIDTPYSALVQSYQKCHYDVYQTLTNQAGIAVGNIQIVAPLCVALLMIVTYLHKCCNKVPLDESYSKGEKDSALDAYAMSLLLARDDRLKTVGFRNNNSIITLIAEELGEHTMLSDNSHKTRRQSNTMRNLSSSSLNSNPESPSRRMYNRFKTLSRSNSAVLPSGQQDFAIEVASPVSPDVVNFFVPHASRKYKTLEHEQKQEVREGEMDELQTRPPSMKPSPHSNNRGDSMMQMVDIENGNSFKMGESFAVFDESNRTVNNHLIE